MLVKLQRHTTTIYKPLLLSFIRYSLWSACIVCVQCDVVFPLNLWFERNYSCDSIQQKQEKATRIFTNCTYKILNHSQYFFLSSAMDINKTI